MASTETAPALPAAAATTEVAALSDALDATKLTTKKPLSGMIAPSEFLEY